MELFLDAVLQVFSLGTIQWVLLGIAAGLFIGLVPGLGGITFMSIALPFMLVMPTEAAFGMLVGFIAVGTTSDTIPAVLIAVPGSSAGQATVLDGHAMARKGRAARALGASFTAAVLGGIVGALALLLSVPILRPLVLSFGYPEFFMLALWGLSMVARLSSGAVIKGLIMAGFGLMLGSIGSEARSGYPRWDFGSSYLLDGVNLGVLAMAIFAIPELISLAVRRTTISNVPPITNLVHGQLQGARDTLRNWVTVVRGGLIGALVSVIPGMGGSVSGWLAYGVTVQTSRDKSQFGKGDVRGVIGPDSAANASDGGNLIPTLGFGVPGSGGMVFLLAVFSAHGIQTGPNLLTTGLDVIYFFVIGLVVANIIGATICFFSANQFAKLSYAPYYFLFAIFIPILFLSAYQSTLQVGNLLVLVLLAIIAYVLRQFGWPRPPLLLGFVLSPVLEDNLSSSVAVHGGVGWLDRPIVLVLAGLILLGFCGPSVWRLPRAAWASISTGKSARKGSIGRQPRRLETDLGQHAGGGVATLDLADPVSQPSPRTLAEGSSQLTDDAQTAPVEVGRHLNWFGLIDLVLTLALLAVVSIALWQTPSWPDDAKRFPELVGAGTLALIAIQVLQRFRRIGHLEHGEGATLEMPADVQELGASVARRSAMEFGWLAALLIAVWIFGLAIVMPIFTLAYLRIVGKVKWRYAILTSVGFAIFEWALFDQLANLYWYDGLFSLGSTLIGM